jgi:hypothetical protein
MIRYTRDNLLNALTEKKLFGRKLLHLALSRLSPPIAE